MWKNFERKRRFTAFTRHKKQCRAFERPCAQSDRNSRGRLNEESYALAIENRGQMQHNDGRGYDTPYSIRWEHFASCDLMEHYFRALIERCNENHIQFISRGAPMNGSLQASIDGEVEWDDAENFSDP